MLRFYVYKIEEVIKMTYYCPECGKVIECIRGCGSTGYFCNNCNKLISSKAVLTEKPTQTDKQEER